MEPSLERTRRLDHPMAMLVLFLLVVVSISGYLTLQLISRDQTSACEQALGRIRIHMAANAPPSVMDTASWDEITSMYEMVNVHCAESVAEPFRVGEFAVWSAPALQFGGAFFGEADSETGSGVDAPSDVPADAVDGD